jgi:hypothetical protein
MSGLDFDFWRKERVRVLSKPFNYREDVEVGNYLAAINSILEMEKKPLEGDGLTMARCEGCGGLSLVMLKEGKPIAYVCPPDMALLRLAEIIVDQVVSGAESKVEAKKSVIIQ